MSKLNFGSNLFGTVTELKKPGNIAGNFLMLPSSVLNARDGWWMRRKRAWIKLGIQSEVGREGANQKLPPGGGGGGCWLGGKKTKTSGGFGHVGKEGSGASIFDPVLCELVYRWFCPLGGTVVDPFAGGSVRGIVAYMLGRKYWGCELRQIQIDANREQRRVICNNDNKNPEWLCGDSGDRVAAEAPHADLIFSCPPYGNLEKYSDDSRDLSNMSFEDFVEAYQNIIHDCYGLLANNRYAAWVVGDYRDSDGNYRCFVEKTVECFLKAGFKLWNHAILVTPVGSIPIRITKQFKNSKKLAKTHQNLLVFVKGSGKKAADVCGEIYTGW